MFGNVERDRTETARNDRGLDAVTAQEKKEFLDARVVADALDRLLKHGFGRALQKRDAQLQIFRKGKMPLHRAARDVGHLFADAEARRHVVDALVVDQGAVHVEEGVADRLEGRKRFQKEDVPFDRVGDGAKGLAVRFRVGKNVEADRPRLPTRLGINVKAKGFGSGAGQNRNHACIQSGWRTLKARKRILRAETNAFRFGARSNCRRPEGRGGTVLLRRCVRLRARSGAPRSRGASGTA